MKVGDPVVGLGNAGGLGGKPIEAAGKVTGLDKSITATNSPNGTSERLNGLIETDADIQPGDSGGSLIDADGTVIGIITAGSVAPSRNGETDTDGYAVPINQAMQIAQDIRDGKASDTIHIGASAFLGMQVSRPRLRPASSCRASSTARPPRRPASLRATRSPASTASASARRPTSLRAPRPEPPRRHRLGHLDRRDRHVAAPPTSPSATGPVG